MVNLLERAGNNLLTRKIHHLRDIVRVVRGAHPFKIDSWVVLSDHFNCLIQLPEDDSDFTLRWRLIKSRFSKSLPLNERRSAVRIGSGDRGI